MKVWKSGRRVRLCRKISGKGIKVEMPKIEENWWRQDWVSEGKKKKKKRRPRHWRYLYSYLRFFKDKWKRMLAGFSGEKFNSGGTYHFLSKDIESLRGRQRMLLKMRIIRSREYKEEMLVKMCDDNLSSKQGFSTLKGT